MFPEIRDPLRELRAWQRFHIKLTGLYGGTVLLSLLLVSLVFYSTSVDAEFESLQERLLATVTSLAESIDAGAITTIPLESTEMSPLHETLKKRFEEVAAGDPDVETIYVLRPTNQPTKLRFLVDYAKDGNVALPGELYDATDLPVMLKGFTHPAVEDELYADQYGLSLSGYAPIVDQEGVSVAIVGADVQATRVQAIRGRVIAIVVPVFGVVAVLIGLVSLAVARSVRQPLTRIIDAAAAISRGELDTRIGMTRRDEFGLMSRHFDDMAEGLKEREFIRQTFGRYVSEDVAQTLLDGPDRVKLGGEERVVTVLLCDLRGYATISEQMPPAQIVAMLNQYLGEMSTLVEAHRGCVIEFLGDAILAVFGAPHYVADHEEAAVRCAVAMRERLRELNEEWRVSGYSRYWKQSDGQELSARIGIHSGRVVAGNLGSSSRMKYGVIGDTVNVAARLEALNKELGTDILLSEDVYAHLPQELTADATKHGERRVRGREQTVRVYSL